MEFESSPYCQRVTCRLHSRARIKLLNMSSPNEIQPIKTAAPDDISPRELFETKYFKTNWIVTILINGVFNAGIASLLLKGKR